MSLSPTNHTIPFTATICFGWKTAAFFSGQQMSKTSAACYTDCHYKWQNICTYSVIHKYRALLELYGALLELYGALLELYGELLVTRSTIRVILK
jgi:hypothetical protein